MKHFLLTSGLLMLSGTAMATIDTIPLDAPPTLGLLGLGVVVAILAARSRNRKR